MKQTQTSSAWNTPQHTRTPPRRRCSRWRVRPGSLHTRRALGFSQSARGGPRADATAAPGRALAPPATLPPAAASLRKTQLHQAPRHATPSRLHAQRAGNWWAFPLAAVHTEPHACVLLATQMRGPHHTARILLSTISRTVILDKNTEHPRVGTECGVLTLGFCPVSGRRRSSSSSPVAARPSPPATSQKRARSELCASETLTRTPAASP